jgi:hypothetical protein
MSGAGTASRSGMVLRSNRAIIKHEALREPRKGTPDEIKEQILKEYSESAEQRKATKAKAEQARIDFFQKHEPSPGAIAVKSEEGLGLFYVQPSRYGY